jgi:hypothetical protein
MPSDRVLWRDHSMNVRMRNRVNGIMRKLDGGYIETYAFQHEWDGSYMNTPTVTAGNGTATGSSEVTGVTAPATPTTTKRTTTTTTLNKQPAPSPNKKRRGTVSLSTPPSTCRVTLQFGYSSIHFRGSVVCNVE